jgi:hypothetical protein
VSSFPVIEDMYQSLISGTGPSEIREHLPTLRDLASRCDHVTELGVNTGQSTTAFLSANPKHLVCVDICKTPEVEKLIKIASDRFVDSMSTSTEMKFIEADSRIVDLEPTELLFIDTTHTLEHLRSELKKHSHLSSRYIVLHDTVSASNRGWWYESEKGVSKYGEGVSWGDKGRKRFAPGISLAIQEFLYREHGWTIERHDLNSHGLMVLGHTS